MVWSPGLAVRSRKQPAPRLGARNQSLAPGVRPLPSQRTARPLLSSAGGEGRKTTQSFDEHHTAGRRVQDCKQGVFQQYSMHFSFKLGDWESVMGSLKPEGTPSSPGPGAPASSLFPTSESTPPLTSFTYYPSRPRATARLWIFYLFFLLEVFFFDVACDLPRRTGPGFGRLSHHRRLPALRAGTAELQPGPSRPLYRYCPLTRIFTLCD